MKKFILLLISVVTLASCSPHTTPAKHRRYHKSKMKGPDFPGTTCMNNESQQEFIAQRSY